MKKFYQYALVSLVLLMGFSSCSDEDMSKQAIDAQYDQVYSQIDPASTLKLASLTALSYNKLSAQLNVSDPSLVLEQGLEYATTEDFSDAKQVLAESIESSNDFQLPAVPGTTYYVRAYAVLKNYATIYSATQTVTTPEFTFSLEGTYTLSEIWSYYSEEYETGYEITLAFADGSETTVEITNLFNEGKVITGEYDPETGMIMIPNGQVLMDDLSGYGEAWLDGADDEGAPTDFLYFVFDEKTGVLESGFAYLNVSLGTWDLLSISAVHN